MKSKRPIVASIFLAVFCLIQLADLHVLNHDANDADCQICLLTSDKQDDGFLPTEITKAPCIITIPADVVRSNYEQHYFTASIDYSFLNKAPPTA